MTLTEFMLFMPKSITDYSRQTMIAQRYWPGPYEIVKNNIGCELVINDTPEATIWLLTEFDKNVTLFDNDINYC